MSCHRSAAPVPTPAAWPAVRGTRTTATPGDFRERGIKEAHGYMTEYVVDHERYLNLVPPDLREIAVLAEPLTIAEKALAQIFWMMQHRPPWLDPETPRQERGRGLSALVLGIGPVGLLGAMTLATAGFTTYVYSREVPPSPRIDLVTAIGATYVSSQTATFARPGRADRQHRPGLRGGRALPLRPAGVAGTGHQRHLRADRRPWPAGVHRGRSGSPHAGHGAEEPGAAGHGQRRARRLRIRAAGS